MHVTKHDLGCTHSMPRAGGLGLVPDSHAEKKPSKNLGKSKGFAMLESCENDGYQETVKSIGKTWFSGSMLDACNQNHRYSSSRNH